MNFEAGIPQARHFPDLDGPVPTGRMKPIAIRAERQAGHQSGVTAQVPHQSARSAVPDADNAVFTCGRNPSIRGSRTERDRMHFSGMSAEGLHRLSRFHIANCNREVPVGHRQSAAIGTEIDRERDAGHVTGKRVPRLLRLILIIEVRRVPEFHRPVAGGGGQVPTVTAECDAAHRRPRVTADRSVSTRGLSRLCIPGLHDPISSTRDQESAVGAERHRRILS